MNDLKRKEYGTARALELDYESQNKPLPNDFRRRVNDKMQDDAMRLAKEFEEQKKPKTNKNGYIKVKAPDGSFWNMTQAQIETAKSKGVIFESAK